jgi:hypothetical protein
MTCSASALPASATRLLIRPVAGSVTSAYRSVIGSYTAPSAQW